MFDKIKNTFKNFFREDPTTYSDYVIRLFCPFSEEFINHPLVSFYSEVCPGCGAGPLKPGELESHTYPVVGRWMYANGSFKGTWVTRGEENARVR